MATFGLSSPLEPLELNHVAENLGPFEWRKLGLYLGIPETRLSNWERQYMMNSEQAANQMLFTWHNNQHPEQERTALIQALENCRLRNLSEKLKTGECRKGLPSGMRPVPSENYFVNRITGLPEHVLANPYLEPHKGVPASPKEVKHEVTEMKLRDLSLRLGSEWRTLGTYLGFPSSEIEQLQEQHRVVKECIFQMLLEWRNRKGNEATKDKLKKALGRAERTDLEDFVDAPDDA